LVLNKTKLTIFQLSQKCNNANDGDAIKSQEKQGKNNYFS